MTTPDLAQATVDFAALAGLPISFDMLSGAQAPVVVRSHLQIVPPGSCESDLLNRAIEIVAQQAAASAVNRAEWKDYPEIGEGDWHIVLALLAQANPFPDRALFDAAYEYLAARTTMED